ncbi:lysophospholipid acyltransferase family protein [Shewanella sp. 1_MG-2023]|uniref:lysophospholipid acyltransferase family protein n=1 Tax=unclassified Shewanella TaxID=196818 RepID=UPI0026E25D85|nr:MULTISPECIES: lysophospholipid acyltransferase family protein [unclassified Shewanella]MDO6612758.1 lysophospholipid acyltransferase family protein [Shewanella sp. 7_MG-2023]MDO6772719.1 lysophospholipid acyltransferase family protein [Shewanella sp. 2_MG-2023]MDO6794883.1 lysophospholipid acyltransferase family protein [Shewanella sp. 1_MG-2023]
MFRKISLSLLTICGWQFEGSAPHDGQFIMVVGPHTSNWDFIIGIIARSALGINIHFLGKHQLFIPPWGWFFKWLGGSPVDRRKNNNMVDAAVQHFEADNQYKLALAPEGTRSAVTRWKTGFYHIAVKAKVPIITVGLDFSRKSIVLNKPIDTSDDMSADMNQILDFFRGITGHHPKVIPDYQPSKTQKPN